MIQPFEFDGQPKSGHVALDNAIFEALPGDTTRLTIHSVFQPAANRDGKIEGGMERSLSESQGRLDELLARLKI